MPDVFTRPKRSAVMARIRSRGNRDTELALARLLRARGITGWRKQQTLIVCSSQRQLAHSSAARSQPNARLSVRADSRRRLRVKVDFVFRRERVAIFVDGCFWHGCPIHSPSARWLRKSSMPTGGGSRRGASAGRTGKAFWREKLASNRARDRAVNRTLRRAGWRVLRVWEHQLRNGEARSGRGATNGLVRRIRCLLLAGRRGAAK